MYAYSEVLGWVIFKNIQFFIVGPLQEVPPESAEQHRRRGHRHVPAVHQPRHRVPLRDGHRRKAATAEHQARLDAHVQDLAEHRQPRRVLEGAAHGLLQRFCQKQLRSRQEILHPGLGPFFTSDKALMP